MNCQFSTITAFDVLKIDFMNLSISILFMFLVFEDESWLSIQMSWHYFIRMILMLSCDATHLIELPKAKSQSGNYIGNTWTSGNLPMAGSCARSEFSNRRTFCCYPSRNYIQIPLLCYAVYTVLQNLSYLSSLFMK